MEVGMPWKTPTLSDLAERTRASFQTYLPASSFTVWPSAAGVSAKVIAGRMFELFSRQSFIARQALVSTATGSYLEQHGQEYGITREVEVKSYGGIVITGGTSGTLIPAGTQFQNATGGLYETVADVYLDAAGTGTINVQAAAAGADQNEDGSNVLTMTSTVPGAPATAAVAPAGIFGGADVEDDESLRARILFRLRHPPAAGSLSDYQRWAMEVPGVTRAWVEPAAYGPGTVGIWFMMDDAYADGIPTAADVATVQGRIDEISPITANATVMAPNREPIRIEVEGLSPLTPKVVENVKAELAEMIRSKAQTSTASNTQYFRASWVWQAISNATGERYHRVMLPQEDYAIPAGSIPVYDETYVTLGG